MAEEKIKTCTDAQEKLTAKWLKAKIRVAIMTYYKHMPHTTSCRSSHHPFLPHYCRFALFIFKTITIQTHTM